MQHLPEGLLLQQALRQESPTCLSLQAAIEVAPPSTGDIRLYNTNKDLQLLEIRLVFIGEQIVFTKKYFQFQFNKNLTQKQLSRSSFSS